MLKNKSILLALVMVGSLSACSGKATQMLAEKPFFEPARVVDQLADSPAGPDRTSEETYVAPKKTASKLLLNHRVIGMHFDSKATKKDTVQLSGHRQANHTGKNLSFTSADPAVATVDENGLVTAVAAGKTSIEVADKNNADLKTTIPVIVYPDVAERKANTILADMSGKDADLKEIVDHELYEKTKYKVVEGERVMQLYALWDQNLVCSYDDAYFRIYETDGDIKTEGGSITFKDYEWIFHTTPYYDCYTYHQSGDVKNYFPASMVNYMDEEKSRTAPLFDILDNIFVSGRDIFTNTVDNAKLDGFLEYARSNYSNVKKNVLSSNGNGTFVFDCTVTYSDITADQDDENRYGIPYGTPTPSTYNLRYIVEDYKILAYSNHGIMRYTIGDDNYIEEYNIEHFYERLTDENRDTFIYIPDRSEYTLVDYLFAV